MSKVGKTFIVSAIFALLLSSCSAPVVIPTSKDPGTVTQSDGQQPEPNTNEGGDGLAEGAAPVQSNVTEGTDYTYTVTDYLLYMLDDLNAKWTAWFVLQGYSAPLVGWTVIQPGETFVMSCGNEALTDTTDNAYYCGNDFDRMGGIWLPVTTFQKMWTGQIFTSESTQAGDFGAAIIVAHEFGHHVQDELLQQSIANGEEVTKPTGKNVELIADCFAGVWAATTYYDGLMEGTDFDEAVAALNSIGDKVPGMKSPHGSADERVAALTLGYNDTSDPIPCITTYWK